MIEYFFANLWAAWLATAVLLLVVELCTGGFVVLCFAIGAACAAVASAFSGIYVQLIVFIVFTALSVSCVRPFALRCIHKHGTGRVSNADAILGRKGIVSEAIKAGGYGRVSIDGDDWKACAVESEELPAGTPVEIVGRDSVIVKVTKTK